MLDAAPRLGGRGVGVGRRREQRMRRTEPSSVGDEDARSATLVDPGPGLVAQHPGRGGQRRVGAMATTRRVGRAAGWSTMCPGRVARREEGQEIGSSGAGANPRAPRGPTRLEGHGRIAAASRVDANEKRPWSTVSCRACRRRPTRPRTTARPRSVPCPLTADDRVGLVRRQLVSVGEDEGHRHAAHVVAPRMRSRPDSVHHPLQVVDGDHQRSLARHGPEEVVTATPIGPASIGSVAPWPVGSSSRPRAASRARRLGAPALDRGIDGRTSNSARRTTNTRSRSASPARQHDPVAALIRAPEAKPTGSTFRCRLPFEDQHRPGTSPRSTPILDQLLVAADGLGVALTPNVDFRVPRYLRPRLSRSSERPASNHGYHRCRTWNQGRVPRLHVGTLMVCACSAAAHLRRVHLSGRDQARRRARCPSARASTPAGAPPAEHQHRPAASAAAVRPAVP